MLTERWQASQFLATAPFKRWTCRVESVSKVFAHLFSLPEPSCRMGTCPFQEVVHSSHALSPKTVEPSRSFPALTGDQGLIWRKMEWPIEAIWSIFLHAPLRFVCLLDVQKPIL